MSFLVAHISHTANRWQRAAVDAVFNAYELRALLAHGDRCPVRGVADLVLGLFVGGRFHDWDCALGSDVLAEAEAAVEVSEPAMPSYAAVRAYALIGGRHPRVVERLGGAECDAAWIDRLGDSWKWMQGQGLVEHWHWRRTDGSGVQCRCGRAGVCDPAAEFGPYVEVLTPQVPPLGAESVPPSGDESAAVTPPRAAAADHPLCGDLYGRYGCNRPPGHDGPHELAHLHGCVIKRWTTSVVELDAPGCVHVGKNTTA